ncbi:MAG: leucine-rich repeat domain-containing protein [Clostridia bacterium]|nr:leucine-rich repeat domain-containing protein [Clostridia bacterium]
MKKCFLFLLLLTFLPLTSALASGETYTCGDFRYTLLEDGSACLIAYIGVETDVFIPAELDGHPITAVQGNPFCAMYDFSYHLKDCTVAVAEDHPYLEVVDGVLFGRTDHRLIWYPRVLGGEAYTVPEGTEIIGRHAFYACKELTAVELPESVTRIENHAFRACGALVEIALPEGLTEIGECAFMGCRVLETLALPSGLESIGWKAFDTCPMLTLMVHPGLFAEAYCIQNGLEYIYTEIPNGENEQLLE